MLTAAAIAVLMKLLCENTKEEMKQICIGIDGSPYRFHPRFNMIIQRHLKVLASVLLNYELRISADGTAMILQNLYNQFYLDSSVGSAICAITASEVSEALRKGEIQKLLFYQQHDNNFVTDSP